jgi:hypothetical protein
MSGPSIAALRALAQRWAEAKAAERANYQLYLIELCEALGVERPRPAGGGYQFEFPIAMVSRDGKESSNWADLYKAGHFLLEAKDEGEETTSDVLLRKAFGQARIYAGQVAGDPPPYLLVLDVGRTLVVWDRWSGSFGGFSAGRRINLAQLPDRPEDVRLLCDIWEDPSRRDPRSAAIAVTKEIATRLARLATTLEDVGYAQERVARFLMRCVFTMFAEDVGLLPDEPFRQIIDKVALDDPTEFVPLAEDLWRAMDEGKRFMLKKLLRFNGHFFAEAEALPLDRAALQLLLDASKADWANVEPTIFGTLLVRALDPDERHRLGAEYTPREFIERLVRPTVEEPIRERWTAVQAEVVQLLAAGKPKGRRTAEQRLRDFHEWLRGLRFLDPACGSGNFLYVTMHIVKRIEVEVIRTLEEVTGHPQLRLEEVGPWQFHGIEVKPWAREIAELTLWIGFHQFWRQHHDVQPEEPVLRDTRTLELRDAVLSWSAQKTNNKRERPDPTPRIPHPVTGELVPDPSARIAYVEYLNPAACEWPEADFIVGNPPYLGSKRMRAVLGDGYVDALRAAYPQIPEAADLVMYWWKQAADAVASGRTIAAGLITTNSITQSQNRAIITAAREAGALVRWAIADHYWNEGGDDARVRVAMTVLAKNPVFATLVTVDGDARMTGEVRVPRLNDDLTAHADVSTAASVPLRANEGLSSFGFMLNGPGFILERAEAEWLLAMEPKHAAIIRPYRNGRDIAQRPRDVFLIDFGLRTLEQASDYPVLLDIVRDRVKPDRDAVRDKPARERWWQFARPRGDLREALRGLPKYIATVETAIRRYFVFLDAEVAPDHMIIAIASADPFVLGVLSSQVHVTWALAAGARLGIDATPRYNKGPCLEAFPFPACSEAQRRAIGALAERIDAHRRAALARDESVTMTVMYHVVEKLRSGAALSAKERAVHEAAACGTLRALHDELDAAVAAAYGWSWPEASAVVLERLVALHDVRVAEERSGMVRWLRPEYQTGRLADASTGRAIGREPEEAASGSTAQLAPASWPADAVNQILALQQLANGRTISVDDACASYPGAPRGIVARHLETLALLGELHGSADGRYASV